ncbi:hypothetical protein C0993_009730 [Termitomyces sp. T159_Od127]|nr:hypothetical protein C0993_009730 [Termitomyces sp. T159_Od127]
MRANLLLVQVQGLSAEAPCNKVEGMMHLWQKWRTMQGGGITWERDGELLEWCMARYCDNLGTEWLAPFANDFAPAAPSFDEELEALLAGEEPLVLWSDLSPCSKEVVIALLVEQDLQRQEEFWQEVAKESEADTQWRITNSLEALAHEGLGLGEATGAGKGSQQEQEEEEEEEEGAKKKTPDTMAGAAMGVATLAARKVPVSGAKELVSPTKKGSPTKPASKCRGHPTPRYEVPMQQDFSDKELAHLLTPRWAEAVVDMGVEAGVVLKETKGKATMDLATHQAFKEEWRVRSNASDPMVEKTYHQAVLVRRVWAVVEKARKAEAQGEAVGLSKKSLALLMHQGDEERGSGKGKHKASLPLSPMDKGKKRARVVSLAAVTPEVESEGDEEDKARCLGVAIEASKAALGIKNLASPSCQAEVPQDVGTPHEEMEQDEDEEEAEVGPEAALQAQPWGWGSPQWSWLLEWGANNPAIWNVSSGDEPES